MKNLIITAGIVMYLVAAMGYQNRWNITYHKVLELKYAADEAAATACLCLDLAAYGQGRIDFDRAEAERKARAITAANLKSPEFDLRFFYIYGSRPGVGVHLRKDGLGARSVYEYVAFD